MVHAPATHNQTLDRLNARETKNSRTKAPVAQQRLLTPYRAERFPSLGRASRVMPGRCRAGNAHGPADGAHIARADRQCSGQVFRLRARQLAFPQRLLGGASQWLGPFFPGPREFRQSPVTAARPRWFCTTLPFSPRTIRGTLSGVRITTPPLGVKPNCACARLPHAIDRHGFTAWSPSR